MFAHMLEKNSPIDRRLPPLNALRVFEAAARHLSFAKAALELHVTHGAVSRQIKLLETSLSLALFERRNRAVFLTPQGVILFAACKDIMGRLAEVVRELQGPTTDLPLVLSCEPTIAIRWLVPRLPDFRRRHPKQQIHLLTGGGHIEFGRDRIDIALRRNDFNWSGECFCEVVGLELVGPVCAPAALAWAAFDADASAASVASGAPVGAAPPRRLHARSRPDAWDRWHMLSRNTPRVGPAASAGAALIAACAAAASDEVYEHFYLSLQAAGAGLGVAIGSAYMVEDDLRDRRLVAPCGFIPDGSDYVLLSPVPFQHDERRLVFLDWLRQAMNTTRLAAQR